MFLFCRTFNYNLTLLIKHKTNIRYSSKNTKQQDFWSLNCYPSFLIPLDTFNEAKDWNRTVQCFGNINLAWKVTNSWASSNWNSLKNTLFAGVSIANQKMNVLISVFVPTHAMLVYEMEGRTTHTLRFAMLSHLYRSQD